jgi:hypothetical protein
MLAQLLGPSHGVAHEGAGGGDHLGAQVAQEGRALRGHALRHGDDEAVAARRRHESQGDAGVAGGGLDDGGPPLQAPGPLGLVHHRHADAVLDAAAGVVRLELAGDASGQAAPHPPQGHERRASDGLDGAGKDPAAHIE